MYKNIEQFPKSASGYISQYLEIKSFNMDKIVLFRLGEFYETYFEDAIDFSKECEVALTKKKFKCGNVVMAGIPSSSLPFYISKLIDSNKKVIICEEEKQDGKIIKRKIARTYTKGSLIDGELIKNTQANYICAVNQQGNNYGISFCDVSTGEFFLTQGTKTEVISEISKLEPSEILCPTEKRELTPFEIIKNPKPDIDLDLSDYSITLVSSKSFLKSSFKIKSDKHKLGQKCANAIVNYIEEAQKDFAPVFKTVKIYDIYDYLYINEKAHKKLELTKNLNDGRKYGSLFWVLDKTKTKMGERKLKEWIAYPLKDINEIKKRQMAILEFDKNQKEEKEISKLLEKCYDIKRLWGKLSGKSLNQKDFLSLIETLKTSHNFKKIFDKFKSPLLKFQPETYTELEELNKFLEKTISEDIENNELIRYGANSELDFLKDEITKIQQWFLDYEKQEQKNTSIKNLKISYKNNFGYFIEMPNSSVKNAPKNYKIRQNLVNSSRFITDEIVEAEKKISELQIKKEKLEKEEFDKIKNYTSDFSKQISDFGNFIALVDVIRSLYEAAKIENFSLPEISNDFQFSIKNGFHPIANKLVSNFTKNGLQISDNKKFVMLTGPNMAGKSTFLKQNAIIAILSQIGSFVSAKNAKLGIFDKIFVRSGSGDNLLKAQSTFISEMLEIKDIIDFGTSKSFVLIDELGSGTSSQDALALSFGICEYIIKKINPLVIFATHLHELKIFAEKYPNNIETLMIGENFNPKNNTFERTIKKGFLNKSYGIDVAKMANLPQEIIETAKLTSAPSADNL